MPKQKPVVNWDEVPVLMDLSFVARILGKSVEWTKKKAQSGELPAIKVGEEWRISKNKLRQYLGDAPTVKPEDCIKAFKAVAAEILLLNEQLIQDFNSV